MSAPKDAKRGTSARLSAIDGAGQSGPAPAELDDRPADERPELDSIGALFADVDNPERRLTLARNIVGTWGNLNHDGPDYAELRERLRSTAGFPKRDCDTAHKFARKAWLSRNADASTTAGPQWAVNVAFHTPYRYSTGDGDSFKRGLYGQDRDDSTWTFRGTLPHVTARVVRRDGSGRRIATDYLISAEQDGPGIVVADDNLTDGSWAGKLGANLSADRDIITAMCTAIRDHAHRTAPEREASPRPDIHSDNGMVDQPLRETLPGGYLEMAPGATSETARAAWQEIAELVKDRPRMALVLGASVAAPFIGPLGNPYIPHWWDLFGESQQGKSTTQDLAASVWGNPRLGLGIVVPWNTTARGPGRLLGQLGILPAFFDDRSQDSSRSVADWSSMVFTTVQGSSRLAAEYRGAGTTQGAPWFGILFSTGNNPLTSGMRTPGIPARVVELTTPFTVNERESTWLKADALPRAYGWMGSAILATYSVPAVREYLADAESRVGVPEGGGVPLTIARHMHIAVAGAMMADALLDTGNALTRAAVSAAIEHLSEHGGEPEHDADRVLSAIAESIAAHRSAWPTVAEYVEHGRPDGWNGPARVPTPMPQHGQAPSILGARSDDGQWVYVLPGTWRNIADDVDADTVTACVELHRRGALAVPAANRKKGEWQARAPREMGQVRVYKIGAGAFDGAADDEPDARPDPAPDITEPRCTVCGEVMSHVEPGQTVHPMCEPTPPPAATGRKSTTPAARTGKPSAERPASRNDVTANARTILDNAPSELTDDNVTAVATSLRFHDELATTFVPRRKTPGEGMRRAYLRPPAAECLVDPITGYQWERPYDGPVTILDRTGAHMSAAATVEIAHGALAHTGPLNFDGAPGYYKVDVFPWTERDRLPHPLGEDGDHLSRKPGPDGNPRTMWVPAPRMALLTELADAGRWSSATVLDSWTGEPVRLRGWTAHVQELREYSITRYGRKSVQYAAVKRAFGMATSLMRGASGAGRRREFKGKVQRTDWYDTIADHSSVMLWRRADACLSIVPDNGPVALRNVDELVIPTAAMPALTAGVTAPIRIDSDGIRLGTFKNGDAS